MVSAVTSFWVASGRGGRGGFILNFFDLRWLKGWVEA
jgi:hypothetical protein